jgi:hypothetical protein
MVGSRVAFAVILGAAVGACATSPGPSQPQAAVPSASPQITILPDRPSPVAAPSPTAVPSASPSATPGPVPTATGPASCVTPPTDINTLIAMEGTGSQDPGGDPVACYGDAPLTFDATWLGGGEADCPAAPEPAWLACSAFSLQAPGDTRKVGPPQLFVAIHPSASPSIPSEPYAQVRVTGHFNDPAAQTCRETQLGDAATLAPAADTIERCRRVFVVTEVVAL